MSTPKTSGTLYLVGTPIGNLEDISFRAVRVLKEADWIACEDTRQTQKLLNHYTIETRTTSYHEHNEAEKAAELVGRLEQGQNIALVTDAGMPGISDPGYRLVRLAVERGVTIVPVPGPAALLSALVASGLPTDSFRFLGFLPSKEGQRSKLLEEVAGSTRTLIFYEAPHRLLDTLRDVVAQFGANRPVVVARELTKLHEEFVRGTARDVLAAFEQRREVKGEITLLVGRGSEDPGSAKKEESIAQRVQSLMQQESLSERDALKQVAKERKIGKSEAYREYQKAKR